MAESRLEIFAAQLPTSDWHPWRLPQGQRLDADGMAAAHLLGKRMRRLPVRPTLSQHEQRPRPR